MSAAPTAYGAAAAPRAPAAPRCAAHGRQRAAQDNGSGQPAAAFLRRRSPRSPLYIPRRRGRVWASPLRRSPLFPPLLRKRFIPHFFSPQSRSRLPPFLSPPPTAFSSRVSLRPPLPPPPPSGAAPMLAPRRKGRARAQAERARALPQLSRRGPAPLQIAPPSSSGGSRGGRREEGTRAERRRDRRAEGSIRWSRPAGGRRARVMLSGAAG